MPSDDALIEALRAAGEVESSGAFSIDVDEAHEKLRRFQLARPQMWLVLLATAAVAGGATHLDLNTDSRNALVSFDGVPLELERLAEMIASLDSSERRLWDVACALHALSTFGPRRILIETWDDRHRAWLTLAGDRVRFAHREPPLARGSGTRITIAQATLDGGEWVDFTERCAFAPLLVTRNGQPRDPWFEIHDALLLRLIGPPFDYDHRFHTHVGNGAYVQKIDGPFPAIICVGGKASGRFAALGGASPSPLYTWDGRARTVLVLNGQSFDVNHPLPGALCIASGAGLEKDLSHGALLAGDALDARLKLLDEAYDAAVIQTARRVSEIGAEASKRQALIALFEAAASRITDEAVLSSALARLRRPVAAHIVDEARIRAHRKALDEQRTRLQRDWEALRVDGLRDLQARQLDDLRASHMDVAAPLELLALLEFADARPDRALALTLEAVEAARGGAAPALLCRLLDQAAEICRVSGDRGQAAVHEAAASAVMRPAGRSERLAIDQAFLDGRIHDVEPLARAALAKFRPRDSAQLDFLDALADGFHLQNAPARALRYAERALSIYALGSGDGTEAVERREIIWDFARAARHTRPPQTGRVHAAGAWVGLNVQRWLGGGGNTLPQLQRAVQHVLAGAPGRDAEQARQAFLQALHLIREAGAGHLAVMQGTLWLGVRLHRFNRAFAEADRLIASLYLCRRLQAAHRQG